MILMRIPNTSGLPLIVMCPPKEWKVIVPVSSPFWFNNTSRSSQKVSSHVIWKAEILIEEDTRNTVQRTMTYFSVPFKVGSLGPPTVLSVSISCPSYFSWISSMVWNLFPFKGDFSLGESQKSQGTKSGLRKAESSGWFDVSPKNSAQAVMYERACCHDEAANH